MSVIFHSNILNHSTTYDFNVYNYVYEIQIIQLKGVFVVNITSNSPVDIGQ